MTPKFANSMRDPRTVVPVVALWLLIAAIALLGGNSREDFPGLVLLYPFAVVAAAAAVLTTRQFDWDAVRAPLMLIGGLAAIAGLQLLPLPEFIWSLLSGRSEWVAGSRMAGVEPGWLPITISPSLTLDMLASLVVPAAFLVALAAAPRSQMRLIVWAILGAMLFSALFGAAQYASGTTGTLSIHPLASLGEATGLFANRNHQALFLAAAPVLASIVLASGPFGRRHSGAVLAIFAGISTFTALTVLMAGSRAGAIAFVIGLGLAIITMWRRNPALADLRDRIGSRRIYLAVAGFVVLILVLGLSTGRFVTLDRLFANDLSSDLRWRVLPTLIDIWSQHWLAGTGFGTFNPLYRIYEPLDLLGQSYLNHAHNDALEIAIGGGVPALAVLAAFGIWLIRRLPGALKGGSVYAGAAAICILQILGASMFDYPLRTPLLACLFLLACVWLSLRDESALPSDGGRLEGRSRNGTE